MIRAVIFDMDGVISDTQVVTSQAEHDVLKARGIDISPDEISRRFSGVRDVEWFATIATEQHRTLDVPAAVAEKWVMMSGEGIRPLPGIRELLQTLFDRGLVLAIGSSANVEFIERVVTTLKIKNFFSAIASAVEVPHGKPAPDVFLLAAERIDVQPVDCVVIEDGISGMQAAAAAGMRCIAYCPHGRPADLPPVTAVVASHDEILNIIQRWT